MSMLPEMLGAESTPHSLEFRGKRYHFKAITFGLMETLEVEHFHQAKQRLRDMRDILDEGAYTRKALDLYEQYSAGEFGFLSEKGQRWVKSPAGATCLLKLCLGISDEELMPLVLSKGEEIKRLMEVVLKEAGLVGGPGRTPPGAEGAGEGETPAEPPFRVGGGNP